jgi:ring-1,2-phenylacetyl-CoA epoxidase subunit PaaC
MRSDQSAKLALLLCLGDSCLILSQRLGEWCGHGPILEEDLALTNVALDLIGQAQLWLGYAAEIEGAGRDADQLAYTRDAGEFRNLLLVEQPNGHFGDTIARQFFFDSWHLLVLQKLCDSPDDRVAEIGQKAIKEVTYHLRRSTGWIMRLGDGTAESHARMQQSVDDLWMFVGELFEVDGELRQPWLNHVGATLQEATLTLPDWGWMQTGGRRGLHTEHLGYILAEMQFLQRAYPEAQW